MGHLLSIFKKIKNSCPWLWNAIESLNGLLIKLFYGRKLNKSIEDSLGYEYQHTYRKLNINDSEKLVKFIKEQPIGFDKFFKPHSFDNVTYRRVLSCGTYVLIGCFDEDRLVGYCFIRFFINKSAFRGKIVDKEYQGRGIAKQMGLIMSKVASNAGFKVYATISKDNVASLKSAKYGSSIEVIKELPDNYLYVEIKENR